MYHSQVMVRTSERLMPMRKSYHMGSMKTQLTIEFPWQRISQHAALGLPPVIYSQGLERSWWENGDGERRHGGGHTALAREDRAPRLRAYLGTLICSGTAFDDDLTPKVGNQNECFRYGVRAATMEIQTCPAEQRTRSYWHNMACSGPTKIPTSSGADLVVYAK